MVLYNAFTGLKWRKPVADLPRKKRSSLGSTVSGRMYADMAMDDYSLYMIAAESALATVSFLLVAAAADAQEAEAVIALILVGCCTLAISGPTGRFEIKSTRAS